MDKSSLEHILLTEKYTENAIIGFYKTFCILVYMGTNVRGH
jgi:hypothetical protein